MCLKFISVVVLYCWLHLSVAARDGKYKRDAENSNMDKGEFVYPDDLDIRKFPKQNLMFHPHHHHSDFYHHHHHGHHPGVDSYDDDPTDGESSEESSDDDFRNISMQIPLDYIQDLNQHNVSDLLINFVDEFVEEEEPFFKNRFGSDGQEERSAAVKVKGAECMPEVKTVNIASTDDPSVLYIPQCTRIERCGGCCKHDLLSCQAIEKDNIAFKVYKTKYTGEKKMKFLGSELVMVEKHNKCKCLCRIQAENCTKFQEYRESECRCACKNHDEKKKCLKMNETKLWNPELCACQCRESIQCSTGSYFDQNECRCLPLPLNRRMASFQRRSYRSEPLPVVPLDGDY